MLLPLTSRTRNGIGRAFASLTPSAIVSKSLTLSTAFLAMLQAMGLIPQVAATLPIIFTDGFAMFLSKIVQRRLKGFRGMCEGSLT